MNGQNKTIHLAGGCFWGIEKLMSSIPGVTNAVSGYANGRDESLANYKEVTTGQTGFREAVKVDYAPDKISLEGILFAYFHVIDSTQKNRQGNDIGSQYQAGIYYSDEKSKIIVEKIAEIQRGRVEGFATEIEPLKNFYEAEEYHQRYLDKNPGGYCHIPREEIEMFSKMTIDPGGYVRPAKEVIAQNLSEEEFRVTQENGTERPFTSPFWKSPQDGIYVDIVTGEPLFSSKDKYQSSCGWPAFSAPIEKPVLVEKEDTSNGMLRTEVRSRAGDSHLGHLFFGDHESPNGQRYCINGASLKFIPKKDMEKEGYGNLLHLLD